MAERGVISFDDFDMAVRDLHDVLIVAGLVLNAEQAELSTSSRDALATVIRLGGRPGQSRAYRPRRFSRGAPVSPAITRRGFAKAGAVVLSAAVAGVSVSAQAAADPDAALVALIASYREAMAKLSAMDDASDPLRELFFTTGPARPDALLWRRSDFQRSSMGVGASDLIGNTKARQYGPRGVEWLRRFKTSADWPAASEARRREIVEAYDAWRAAWRVHSDQIGLTAANEACDRQSDIVSDLEVAICGFTPTTLDGFRAKARWIASSPQADEWAAFLLRDLSGAPS